MQQGVVEAGGRLSRKKWSILLIGLCLFSITMITSLWVLTHRNTSPIPEAIRKGITFPIYYPQQLPPGFKLNANSFSSTPEVLTYSFTYSGDKPLLVSVQPVGGLDTSTFNPTTSFTTYIGMAYVADLSDRTTAAVVGKKSLVLINAPDTIPDAALTAFINDLELVH